MAINKNNEIFDTIIVPAQEWGFQYVLLEKNMWFIQRINEKNLKKLKFIAFYQTSPICAITYYSYIKGIKYNRDERHYDIFLKGKPIKIKPIELDKYKRYLAPQSIKYIKFSKLKKAKKLSDIYGVKKLNINAR
ncbi:MAG: hypothetical protein EHM58_00115 [Ignavibacteriae bacterium]|nr:MAG: hypothetical protein EHM58_00115 [Ignavibacteriota bacterium]